jgi:hypothetical protein
VAGDCTGIEPSWWPGAVLGLDCAGGRGLYWDWAELVAGGSTGTVLSWWPGAVLGLD